MNRSMKNKLYKGMYEYAHKEKIKRFAITLFLFLLSLGLFITGLVATGSKRNLLTIVAVLGMLPACKMLVSWVMSLRVKEVPLSLKDKIDSHKSINGLYHMYFTAYDENYPIDHMYVYGKAIVGLCTSAKFKENAFYEHIKEYASKENITDVSIKIFSDESKYLRRLDEIEANNLSSEPNAALLKLIMDITL